MNGHAHIHMHRAQPRTAYKVPPIKNNKESEKKNANRNSGHGSV